jgi:hypothetical protein
MQQVLRNALIAEKICEVDNSDNYRIQNPYSGQPTATTQAVAGTYSVSAWTLTDDTLTVTDEIVYAEQIFNFESVMNNFDLFADRMDNQNYAVAHAIDVYVLNSLGTNATGTYTTPAGGFTTPSNIAKIMGDCIGKVMGFAQVYKGLFLVIENTDVTGFIQTQVASGFSYADAALNNGFMQSYMGVDIYVARSGTFQTASLGSISVTMSGKRLFGVKNVSTYASPRGVQFIEKEVSGKTGKEVATVGLIGHKLWTQNAGLTVAITLA